MLTVDISELDPEVKRELIRGRHLKQLRDYEEAEQRQRMVAARTGEHRSMDGLGRVRLSIDAAAYHYWGQRLGYKCWSDPQFLREFERDNPHARVKCGGTKIMLGWRADPKFRKRY
jgi:hypothetical protein